MSKYRVIWDREGVLAKFENEEMTFLRENYSAPERSDLPTPMILRDIEPYQNMIDGKMISSRSEHRELLNRHNCIEIGNEKMDSKPMVQPTVDRRKVLHQQLSDMSDRQANKLIKKAIKGL
jgi:hypothetical protein